MKEITERTLKVENVSLGYGETTIVKDLSLEFPKGKITAIIGPNGCGKSTLLRGVSRLLKPLNGDFTLDGKPTHEYSMKGFARMVGLMPQHPIAPEGITVADLVSRGRYPYQGLFKRNSAEDDEAVLLDLLSDLNEQRGTTMIMVLHELNLAARVADYLVAMKDGSIVAQGEAHEVLTRENLHTIFSLKAEVADPFNDGSVVVVPHPRRASAATGSAVAS